MVYETLAQLSPEKSVRPDVGVLERRLEDHSGTSNRRKNKSGSGSQANQLERWSSGRVQGRGRSSSCGRACCRGRRHGRRSRTRGSRRGNGSGTRAKMTIINTVTSQQEITHVDEPTEAVDAAEVELELGALMVKLGVVEYTSLTLLRDGITSVPDQAPNMGTRTW